MSLEQDIYNLAIYKIACWNKVAEGEPLPPPPQPEQQYPDVQEPAPAPRSGRDPMGDFMSGVEPVSDYLGSRISSATVPAWNTINTVGKALNPPVTRTKFRMDIPRPDGSIERGRTYYDIQRGDQRLSSTPLYNAADYINEKMYTPSSRMFGLPRVHQEDIDIGRYMPE